MHRKQKRLQLIEYWLALSAAQADIQLLQNQLVSHIRFNPALLLRALGPSPLPRNLFAASLLDLTGAAPETIRGYLSRHRLPDPITLQAFTATLLPYTPNVLRQAHEKLPQQLQTQHLDRTVEQAYHCLLREEVKQMARVGALQARVGWEWAGARRAIMKDLNEHGRRGEGQGECSLVKVRQWLELWTEVDEYQILNLMRWFGGHEEHRLQALFSLGGGNTCTCPHSPKLQKVRSEARLPPQHYLKLFLRYVETILKSERRLDILREGLRPHRREVELLLHEIASKKNAYTRGGKLVAHLEKALRLRREVVEQLLEEIEHSKFDNAFLFSLFAPAPRHTPNTKLPPSQVAHEVNEVLYTFCLSKATLKSLSRDLQAGVQPVFAQLDQRGRGELDGQDLKMILEEAEIKFREEDLGLLLTHFGDGLRITEDSLQEVVAIQRQQ